MWSPFRSREFSGGDRFDLLDRRRRATRKLPHPVEPYQFAQRAGAAAKTRRYRVVEDRTSLADANRNCLVDILALIRRTLATCAQVLTVPDVLLDRCKILSYVLQW
jgi:hypothetical protein